MSLQTLVDARENLNIAAYAVWSGWAHEQSRRREQGAPGNKGGLNLAPSFDSGRKWPVWPLLVAMVAIGALLGLRFWQ